MRKTQNAYKTLVVKVLGKQSLGKLDSRITLIKTPMKQIMRMECGYNWLKRMYSTES
jgi:hypothetical protein